MKLKKFDVADVLRDDETIVEYLNITIAENDPKLLMKAIGNVARAKGVADISEATGLPRTALYRSLSGDYDARVGTVMKVLGALGIEIEFKVKTVA